MICLSAGIGKTNYHIEAKYAGIQEDYLNCELVPFDF